MTGLSLGTIKNIHARYLKEGAEALKTKPKGGRWRENMTVADEESVVSPFLEKAKAGGVVEIGPIKRAYEAKLGKTVPSSTAYRVLHRQSWRKIEPRPRHPKADVVAQEAFKKTSPLSSPRAAFKRKLRAKR